MDGRALSALIRIKLSAIWLSIANALKSKKRGGKGGAFKSIMYVLVLLFSVCIMMVYFGLLFVSICYVFSESGIKWFYFAIAGAISLIMCFVGSIFTTQAYIFKARDNDLLLSMPIKPSYILVSRMASILLLDYFYSFMVLIPAGAVYLYFNTVSVAGVVIFVLLALVLPLFSQAFACLIAWVLEIITSKLRNKNFFTMFLSIGSLGLYFLAVSKITSFITVLMDNGIEIANAVKEGFFPLYYLGAAITEHNFLAVIIVAITCIIPFAIAYAILSKNFIKLVTMKRTAPKNQYVEKKLPVRSPRIAFMLKDLQKLISSASYMLNAALGGVLGIICVAVLPNKLPDLFFILLQMGKMISINTLAAAMSALVLCAAAGMNYIAAPSISLEAKTLWVIKTVPIHPKEILLGKAYTQIVVTAPFVIAGGIIACTMSKISGLNILLVFVLPLVYTVFCSFFGVSMNAVYPKFDWQNETKVIKQSAAVLITMAVSMVFLLVILGGYILLVVAEIKITLSMYLWSTTAVIAVLDLLLYLYICKGGSKRFEQMSL